MRPPPDRRRADRRVALPAGMIGMKVEGGAVVKREKVIDAQGRDWVSGLLDPTIYFAEVRRDARAQAQRVVAARLARAVRPARHSLAG